MRKDNKPGAESFVREVAENTRQYLRDLQTENETLHALVNSLKTEMDRHQSHQEKLKQQLSEVEKENQRFSQQYVRVEQQISSLSNLCVASYRLHETLDRKELLAIMEEILANIIGSEEIGIFEASHEQGVLNLIRSVGIDAAKYQKIPIGEGTIGQVALTGTSYICSDDASARDGGLTACIPLRVGGRVTGAIAVFRMLPQKLELQAMDHEVFELLATQGAQALYCSKLHAKLGGMV